MKPICGIFALFLFSALVSGQGVAPAKVSKQVELVGVVFRLAGATEYSYENYKDYTDAIHKHFDPHKDHEAVILAKQLHKGGAGYSYVASLAVHMTEPADLALAAPMSESDVKVFGGRKNIDSFIAALRDFYNVSKFEEFWTANRERYAVAERNFASLSNALHPEWFDSFYGITFKGSFNIVIGMGNGINFYGPSVNYPDGSRDIYAVFAPLIEGGEPKLPSDALAFTIHEFNHSFANPFIDKHEKALQRSASRLFSKVEKEMSARAYKTWKIVMYESLVRAATASYLLKYRPGLAAGNRYSDMYEQGFVWVDSFTDLLNEYGLERDRYPTLDSFVPRMAAFYEKVAASDLQDYKAEFERRSPHVVKVEPIPAGDGSIDPKTAEIRITFDRPLDGKGISVDVSGKKEERFPELLGGRSAVSFGNGNTEFVMKVKLEEKTTYGFVLTGEGFRTPDNYPLKKYEVRFKTK